MTDEARQDCCSCESGEAEFCVLKTNHKFCRECMKWLLVAVETSETTIEAFKEFWSDSFSAGSVES